MAKVMPSLVAVALSTVIVGCSPAQQDPKITINTNPYPSTYQILPNSTTLLKNAIVLTGTGERIDDADVLIKDGKISAVGQQLSAAGAVVIDAKGKWITPGIIDVHSHLGVY
ncbi:amidohydrolase, partial [Shewanella sp. SG44-6]|nr:amidohydrolase [Shewanella sp. SG44-6]